MVGYAASPRSGRKVESRAKIGHRFDMHGPRTAWCCVLKAPRKNEPNYGLTPVRHLFRLGMDSSTCVKQRPLEPERTKCRNARNRPRSVVRPNLFPEILPLLIGVGAVHAHRVVRKRQSNHVHSSRHVAGHDLVEKIRWCNWSGAGSPAPHWNRRPPAWKAGCRGCQRRRKTAGRRRACRPGNTWSVGQLSSRRSRRASSCRPRASTGCAARRRCIDTGNWLASSRAAVVPGASETRLISRFKGHMCFESTSRSCRFARRNMLLIDSDETKLNAAFLGQNICNCIANHGKLNGKVAILKRLP